MGRGEGGGGRRETERAREPGVPAPGAARGAGAASVCWARGPPRVEVDEPRARAGRDRGARGGDGARRRDRRGGGGPERGGRGRDRSRLPHRPARRGRRRTDARGCAGSHSRRPAGRRARPLGRRAGGVLPQAAPREPSRRRSRSRQHVVHRRRNARPHTRRGPDGASVGCADPRDGEAVRPTRRVRRARLGERKLPLGPLRPGLLARDMGAGGPGPGGPRRPERGPAVRHDPAGGFRSGASTTDARWNPAARRPRWQTSVPIRLRPGNRREHDHDDGTDLAPERGALEGPSLPADSAQARKGDLPGGLHTDRPAHRRGRGAQGTGRFLGSGAGRRIRPRRALPLLRGRGADPLRGGHPEAHRSSSVREPLADARLER